MTLIVSRAVVTAFVVAVFASSAVSQTKQQPINTVRFPDQVLSFEHLHKAEKFEDLPKYGLVPPEHRNHKAGKNLILLA